MKLFWWLALVLLVPLSVIPPTSRKCIPLDHSISATLIEYSQRYISKHYDANTGMLFEASNKLSVRDTMIGAFTWAEVCEWSLAARGVEKVLSYQILDKDDSTQYGNFLRSVGDNQALDQNWSAFIGSYLLVFYDRYQEKLAPDLKIRLLESIHAAAHHRMQARIPLYRTNIAILSAFVYLRSGEMLNDIDLLNFGRQFWGQFYTFTTTDGIGEYNSPNYYKVDLYGLGFIMDYVQDPLIRSQASQLREWLWFTISQRYHPVMNQLAGPYSRTFTERMIYQLDGLHPFLYRESNGAIEMPYGDDIQAVLPLLVKPSWPARSLSFAIDPKNLPRQFRERTGIVSFSEDIPEIYQYMTTYLGRRIALGSVNTQPINSSYQMRPLIAHALGRAGQVGVFRIWFREVLPDAPFVKAVQNRSSALVLVQYEFNTTPTVDSVEIYLQWFGTDLENPSLHENSSIDYGAQANIRWMDTVVGVKIADRSLPTEVSYLFELSNNAPLLQIALSFPTTQLPVDSNQTVIPIVFGLYIDEENAILELNPVDAEINKDSNTLLFIWESPNGRLELEAPVSAHSRWFVRDRVDNAEPLTKSFNGTP